MGKISKFQPNELAEKSAQKSNDCRLWSPKDALLAALRDLENGDFNPERLVISYVERIDENALEYSYYASNVTNLEVAGLLAHCLARVTRVE